MDIITIGFITVVLGTMIVKVYFEYKMFNNSVYKMLYSGYTEYRIKKKSIIRMSESYMLTNELGVNRIIFYVSNNRDVGSLAFICVILKSGFYIIAVENNIARTLLLNETQRCVVENIINKLEVSVYKLVELPIMTIILKADDYKLEKKDHYVGNKKVVKRNDLVKTIKEIDRNSENIFTDDDVRSIFNIMAQESIDEELSMA